MSRDGPIEQYPWPDKLTARAIAPGADPRVYGYSVENDLARHYRFTDLVLLSLTGELPTDAQSAAFDVALQFLAPLSIAEAPTHAAVLARVCGARVSGINAVAAVALAERARAFAERHASLLDWLPTRAGDPPEPYLATTEADHAATQALQRALAVRGVSDAAPPESLNRAASLITVLYAAGLTQTAQIETALVLASLAPSVGEAMQHAVASFREYPMQLPRFEYEDR